MYQNRKIVAASSAMKIGNRIMLLILAFQIVGCDRVSHDFEMQVDQVDVLQGFIMKGISITGTVESGCIANDDEYLVVRDGKEVLKTIARIVNVAHLKDAESFTGKVSRGEEVTFYIPDGKKEDVQVGDRVIADETDCDQRTTDANQP